MSYEVICYAESEDDIHWLKDSHNLIVRDEEGGYRLCYNGRNKGAEYIGYAYGKLS